MRPVSSVLAICLGLTLLPGCSWIFVDSPPAQHAKLKYFDCTSSRVSPVLDTIGAGLEAVRVGYAASAPDSAYRNFPLSRGVDAALGLGFAALFTASAIYGYEATSECDDAKEALQQRLAEHEPHRDEASPAAYRRPAFNPGPMRCAYDAQCKGDRICQAGECVAPAATSPPVPAPVLPAPGALPPPAPAAVEPPAASGTAGAPAP